MIIDTDVGVDDAVALMFALKFDNIKIIAITCIYGNTKEKNVEINVLKILTVAKKNNASISKVLFIKNVLLISNYDFSYDCIYNNFI